MESDIASLGRGRIFERRVPNPKLRLRGQFQEVARFRQLSLRTEEADWDC